MHRSGRLLLGLAVILAFAGTAEGSSTLMGATLTSSDGPRAVVFDGTYFWHFWTDSSTDPDIPFTRADRYDPASDALVPAGVSIPGVVHDAVWTGSAVLVLGADQLHRFEPATLSVTPLAPPPGGMNAFWDGAFLYSTVAGPSHLVHRYDPLSDTWSAMPYGLGAGNWAYSYGGAAVWMGTYAYLVSVGVQTGKIFRIDPLTGTVIELYQGLSTYHRDAAAVRLGGQAHIFHEDRAYAFVPGAGLVADPDPLPLYFREAVAAARTPCEAYLFGGTNVPLPPIPPGGFVQLSGLGIVRYTLAGDACAAGVVGLPMPLACGSCAIPPQPTPAVEECAGCDDYDDDGIPNYMDNCVWAINPEQADADMDSMGDACDGNGTSDALSEPDSAQQATAETAPRLPAPATQPIGTESRSAEAAAPAGEQSAVPAADAVPLSDPAPARIQGAGAKAATPAFVALLAVLAVAAVRHHRLR